jgi:hypothetical protein
MSVGNNTPNMGYQSLLGICQETTFGTLKTATAVMEFNSEGIKSVIEEKMLEEINSTRHFKKRLLLNETVEGPIEFNFNPASDAQVWLLKQCLGGTVTTSTIASGQYNHTFYTGNMESNAGSSGADVKGLSVSVKRGANDTWSYYGGRVNSLTIKGEVGGPVVFTANMVFKGSTCPSTCPTASFSDVLPVNFSGVTVNTGVSAGSVSEEYFKSFELTINNNIVTDHRVLGSRQVASLPPVKQEVKLKLVQAYDTLTSANRALANTMTAFTILLNTGVTLGSTNYSAIIKIPKTYFNSTTPNVGDNGMLSYEIDCSALYGSSLGATVQFLVTNATTTYA